MKRWRWMLLPLYPFYCFGWLAYPASDDVRAKMPSCWQSWCEWANG